VDVKYLRPEVLDRLLHPFSRSRRVENRRGSDKLTAKALNRVIILFQKLYAMATAPEQLDLVPHDGVFAAAKLITVVS
jgi:hypothetical protein